MKLLAGLFVAVLTVVVTAIGIRLLVLARRRRELPELLIGLSLVLPNAGNVPIVLGLDTNLLGSLAWPAVQLGSVILNTGLCCVALFVWRVFHPESGLAKRVALGLLLMQALIPLANLVLPHPNQQTILYPLEFLGRAGCYAWGAVAALAYWRKMQRRQRLGLADPLVTNRFYLWGVGSLCGFWMISLFTTWRVLSRSGDAPDWLRVLGTLAGLLGAFTVWLTFVPPRWYRNLIVARAERAEAAQS